jgi:hypothetical protein
MSNGRARKNANCIGEHLQVNKLLAVVLPERHGICKLCGGGQQRYAFHISKRHRLLFTAVDFNPAEIMATFVMGDQGIQWKGGH